MKKFRNILAMLMVFVMLVAVMPMNVFAEPSPTFTVKVNNSDNGSVTADPTSAAAGTRVTLTVAPAGGYELDTLTATPNVDIVDSEGKKTFTMPGENVEVTATFKKTETEADKKAKELDDAKAKAKTTVNGLDNLTDDEKKGFTDRIDAATEIDKINPIVEEANKKAAENKKNLEDAKTKAKDEIKNDKTLTEDQKKAANEAIENAKTPEDVKKAVEDAKKTEEKPAPKTGAFTIGTGYTPYGDIEVNKSTADAKEQVTVTVKPKYGYVVSRVYYRVNGTSVDQTINNYYNSYYYERYPGYYYGDSYYDYYRFYDEYRNSKYNYNHYSDYHEFLRYEHRNHYLNYKYWDDRYDDDDYYNWYYYKRNGYRPWYYGRVYDNSLYNTSDKFSMPQANITVYVEFTDWSYYGYDYDDYYYYRARRDRKAEEAKAKAEAAKKEEEEAKAKAEAEKLPQIYENKAVIAIGSNVLDKVSKNVHTVHQMDTPAYVKDGRVMLPLRYVAEALGLQVSWVPETKTVIIWDLTQRVEIPVKSNRIIVNGITYTSDVKPEIKSSRTMLPIANIARALGLIDGSDIIWDQYNKQVTLTRKVLSK